MRRLDPGFRFLLKCVHHPEVIADLRCINDPERIRFVPQDHFEDAASESCQRFGIVRLLAFCGDSQRSQSFQLDAGWKFLEFLSGRFDPGNRPRFSHFDM